MVLELMVAELKKFQENAKASRKQESQAREQALSFELAAKGISVLIQQQKASSVIDR